MSVIIPVWNRVDLTLGCLTSLARHTGDVPFELIVVDNGSTDATPDLLGALEGDVQILTNPRNLGFGDACNQGAAAAGGEYLLFLNNDTVVGPGWLAPLVGCLDEDRRRGAAQPRLLYPDGRLNDAGGLVFANGEAWNYGKGSAHPYAPRFSCRRAPDYLSGACLIVRGEAFADVGGFDPRYAPAYYEDTDLSFALRAAGWKLVYEPASTIIHLEGGTAGTDVSSGLKAYQVRNQAIFAAKWADELAGRPSADPAIVEPWAHRSQGGDGPGESESPAEGRSRSVLLIDPFSPLFDRAAGSLRSFNLARSLRRRGHAVAWYAAGEASQRARYQEALSAVGVPLYGTDPTEVPKRADQVTAWAREFVPSIGDILADRAVDLAVVGPWKLAEVVVPRLRAVRPDLPIVVDTCDLHFVREEREARIAATAASVGVQERRRRELAVYASADAVVCVSQREAEILADLLPGTPVVVIGIAHPPADTGPGFGERHGLLFVGNANHTPNVDAVQWWRGTIAPELARRLPGVELTVVGHDPAGTLAALAGPGVSVAGWVPDTLPYLHAARVSIAPLRYGAGVKGKVGEAMAAGLPTVMTSVGAEGLAIVDGTHALVADDPAAFVDSIVRLYHDQDLWDRLRRNGAAHIASIAGPAAMSDGVDRLIQVVTAGRAAPSPRISVVMNVRNEAGHLASCIASCAGADEVIVADMASDDGSAEIATEAGARVIAVTPTGYCETARQTAIDAASGEWVLVIDADERLSDGGVERLRELAAVAPRHVSAYRLPRPLYVGREPVTGTGWGLDVERHPRFFRRAEVTWPARIHVVPEFVGEIRELPDGVEVHLDHYGFADLAAAIDKFNRYSTVEAAERDADGRRTPSADGPDTPSAADALRDGMREFLDRYQPDVDGALSLSLSMGMFMYRFLTTMKLHERRGWPDAGFLPSSAAMLRAWQAFDAVLQETEAAAGTDADLAAAFS